jgi:hypothetical protein
VSPEACIDGGLTYLMNERPSAMEGGMFAAFGALWLSGLLGVLLLGVVLVVLAPRPLAAATQALRLHPWTSLLAGLLALAATLAAAPLLAATLIGLPLAIVLVAGLVAALGAGLVVGAIACGRLVTNRVPGLGGGPWARSAALAVGVVILFLVGLVPYLGPLAALAAFLFGLGGLVRAAASVRRPLGGAAPPA